MSETMENTSSFHTLRVYMQVAYNSLLLVEVTVLTSPYNSSPPK